MKKNMDQPEINNQTNSADRYLLNSQQNSSIIYLNKGNEVKKIYAKMEEYQDNEITGKNSEINNQKNMELQYLEFQNGRTSRKSSSENVNVIFN